MPPSAYDPRSEFIGQRVDGIDTTSSEQDGLLERIDSECERLGTRPGEGPVRLEHPAAQFERIDRD